MMPGHWRTGVFFAAMLLGIALFLRDDTEKTSHFQCFHDLPEGGLGGRDPWFNTQMAALCVLCLLVDAAVLDYHYKRPPHPKFLLVPKRRFYITVHIISGSLEILMLTWAFFAKDPTLLARAAALVGLLGHATTAAAQTPIVFGVKTIMVPFYVIFIVGNCACAAVLLAYPTDLLALVRLFLALHGYAWVRVCIALFQGTGILRGHEYTVAVLLGSSICTIPVVGPLGQVIYIVATALFHVLEPKLRRTFDKEGLVWWEDSKVEAERDFITADPAARLAMAFYTNRLGSSAASERHLTAIRKAAKQQGVTDKHLAQAVFNLMDADRNGLLEGPEVEALMSLLSRGNAAREEVSHHGPLTFERFYSEKWSRLTAVGPQPSFRRVGGNGAMVAVAATAGVQAVPDREKAGVMFSLLDVDGSGSLSLSEMRGLVTRWGLPSSEAELWLKQFDNDGDSQISFDEFHEHFSAVWKYMAELVVEDRLLL